MKYQDKVMAYADVVQILGPDTSVLSNLLEDKVAKYSLSSESIVELDFWKEVKGRMDRNNFHLEIVNLIAVEKANLRNITQFPEIELIKRTPSTREWIRNLPMLEKEIFELLYYQQDEDIRKKVTDEQSFLQCYRSLKFLNDAITSGLPMEKLFEFIPLTMWSIENLLINNSWNAQFTPMLLEQILPLFRAHKSAVNTLIELINNEEELEVRESVVKIKTSSYFERDYSAPEKAILSVPPKPEEGIKDQYLDWFMYAVIDHVHGGNAFKEHRQELERQHRLAPLTHLHRLWMHVEKLSIPPEEYCPVMDPDLVNKASQMVTTHIRVYNEKNLVAACLSGITNVIIAHSERGNSQLYRERFSLTFDMMVDNLNKLADEKLISTHSVIDAINYAKERGVSAGLY